MVKTAIIKVSELGTNCWLPKRFIEGGSRCDRIFTCSYPEKKKCQAINAEVRHLMEEQTRLITVYHNIDNTIKMLTDMLEK